MFKKETQKLATAILIALFCVLPGCVSPDAVKVSAEIQGIKNDMANIEKLADEMFVWRKSIQAENINYNGAGWVVLVVTVFVGAGFLLIKTFMKRGTALHLLTCAVQKAGKIDPSTVHKIKHCLKQEVVTGRFKEEDRKNIGNFAKKKGTFAKQK